MSNLNECEDNIETQFEGMTTTTTQAGTPFGLTELLTKDGVKPAAEVLAGKRAIGFYFSAHWCPPCRQFTPILSAFYEAAKCTENDMEIIFISSDRDQAAFDDYYSEMPWVALPYSQREKKGEISGHFDVSGIPAFIIVDADGNIKSLEGRNDVMQSVGGVMRARFAGKKEEEITDDDVKLEFTETEASNFCVTVNEWIEKPIYVKPEFMGVEEVTDGEQIINSTELRENNAAFAFYFSASWCPPCRSFTPMLKKFYENTRDTGLEIIFVGLDQEEDAHNQYFAKMPWKAIPWYGDDSDKEDPRDLLTKECGIRGIPHIAVTDTSGKIVATDGVMKVRKLMMNDNVSPDEMQALANEWVAKCQ
jgi:nucleoredoxin